MNYLKFTILANLLLIPSISNAQGPAPAPAPATTPEPAALVPVPAEAEAPVVAPVQDPVVPQAPVKPAEPIEAPALIDLNDNPNAVPRALGDRVRKEAIEQPFMTGDVMAKLYWEWTGKRVLVSKAAMAKQISFVQPGGLTYSEAAELLEQAVLLEDMVFLPSVNDPNVVKLVLATNSRKNGIPVIRNGGVFPEGDKVVTYVMTFDHIQPDEAMKVFNSVVSELSPQGSIVSVPNTSSLIITENTALIKSLIEIKSKIDMPQELSMKKMFELEHADAEEVATQVQEIMNFSAEQSSLMNASPNAAPAANDNRGGRGQNNNNNNNNNNNTTLNTAQNLNLIKVLAITRTNSLWVMGRPIDIEFAETVIADFDKPIKRRSYSKHKLKFLSVSEFLPVASNAILRTESSTANDSAASANNANANRANTTATTTGTDGSLAESERLEYPESLLVGKTLLVADNANNSLIVQGPPQSISLIQELIKEMDVASEQVQITAIFGRYNITDSSDFGIDFAMLNQSSDGNSIAAQNRTGYPLLVDPSSLTTTTTDENGVTTTTNAIPDSIAGLSIYGKIGNNFLPTLRALQSSGNFKLLSRPTIYTTNNKKAVLSSGQSIAVPTNSLSQSTGVVGTVSQSTNIEFKDVVLKLEVIPLVNSDDEVTLQVSLTNDTIVGSQTIDGNSIPTIGKEELLTTITVPNGGTVALGGLITERDSEDVSGVPILSKIPGIKKLFTSTTKSSIREELVIFIQPRVVNNDATLQAMKENNKRFYELADGADRFGELLPRLKEELPVDKVKATPKNNRFRSSSRR
ncbi:MAG: secretin N-terminal domain-containing protein [Akkermansiaceae bacterium]